MNHVRLTTYTPPLLTSGEQSLETAATPGLTVP
jgi:hypothetical protein